MRTIWIRSHRTIKSAHPFLSRILILYVLAGIFAQRRVKVTDHGREIFVTLPPMSVLFWRGFKSLRYRVDYFTFTRHGRTNGVIRINGSGLLNLDFWKRITAYS